MLLSLLVLPAALAYEADTLTDRDQPLPDVSQTLDERVQEVVLEAIAWANTRSGCHETPEQMHRLLARAINVRMSPQGHQRAEGDQLARGAGLGGEGGADAEDGDAAQQHLLAAEAVTDQTGGEPRQRLGLALIGRDIVAKREHPVGQRGRRRRVQHRPHPRRPRQPQRMHRHPDRLLQLGDEHIRRLDQRPVLLDIRHRDLPRRAGRDDDRVIAARVLDEDESRPV